MTIPTSKRLSRNMPFISRQLVLFALLFSLSMPILQAQNLLEVEGHAKIIGRLDITDKVNGTNVFLGTGAGIDNTTGVSNTAIGRNALFRNTIGKGNIAIGISALSSNTEGEDNIAIGGSALFGNVATDGNTAIGNAALSNNSGGSSNTAVGWFAASMITVGDFNTSLGAQALQNTTNGSHNTALGMEALYSNTTGFANTATGSGALYSNTIGNYNTATGVEALYSNTTGTSNTATGASALLNNTTGDENTANGMNALRDNTSGEQNTAIGSSALNKNTIGDRRTALGYSANTTGVAFSNNTALGANTNCTANNQVRLGNASVTSIGGFADWTDVSDQRFKNQIKENVQGLDFIMKLRPVTYHLNQKAVEDFTYKNYGQKDTIQWEGKYDAEKLLHTGFIAQEVEAAAKELDYDFSGVDKPKNDKDFYGLRYAKFTVPLVKAVQQQQLMLKEKNEKIEQMEAKLKKQQEQLLALSTQLGNLSDKISKTSALNSQGGIQEVVAPPLELKATLEQNFPNPFHQQTEIRYSLPTAIQTAQILITDLSGKLLKTYPLQQQEEGSIKVSARQLNAGIYAYTLVIDGKIIDTKQMVLTK